MTLSAKDRKGIVLIGVAALAVVGLIAAKFVAGNALKAATDGCVGTPSASTVILLDHSETLTDQTRAEITARALAHVRDRVSVNERVTVFTVTDISRKSLKPVFSRCKPPQEGNRLVEDAKGIAKAYTRAFVQPLTAALAVNPSNAKESPIAQAVIDVSLSQYLRTQKNSLLVFSDLMEHTPPKFSLYSCGDSARTVAMFRDSRRGAQERPKFTNTAVYLNVVPRMDLPKSSLKCRDQLWPWFFGDNEGGQAKAEIDYLPGA